MTALFFSWQTYYVLSALRPILDCSTSTYLAEEPSNEVPEDNSFVCLIVTWGRRNGRNVPQIRLPFVHVPVGSLSVDEDDSRGSFDQPASVQYTDTAVSHGLDGSGQFWYGWLELFHFDSSLLSSVELSNY